MEEEEMKKAESAAQQGQNHTMIEGQNHTMFEGQITVFKGQNYIMFEGPNHTMFEGVTQCLKARITQSFKVCHICHVQK